MADLSWRMAVGPRIASIDERFVIGVNVKFMALDKMSEMMDGKVHRQQLAVESAVASFCWLQFPRKVRDWVENAINFLL